MLLFYPPEKRNLSCLTLFVFYSRPNIAAVSSLLKYLLPNPSTIVELHTKHHQVHHWTLL